MKIQLFDPRLTFASSVTLILVTPYLLLCGSMRQRDHREAIRHGRVPRSPLKKDPRTAAGIVANCCETWQKADAITLPPRRVATRSRPRDAAWTRTRSTCTTTAWA